MGSIVGLIFSYFSYHQYYPRLASPTSHRPFSPRILRDDGINVGRVRREEHHPDLMEGGYTDVELQNGSPPANPAGGETSGPWRDNQNI